MTRELLQAIFIIWVHWFADFVLQTDEMAKGKSTSNRWLTKHVALYSGVLCIIFGPTYAFVNGVLHWVTDYFSSRASSKLYKKGDIHNFFVVVGFDQAIHVTCLLLTMKLIWLV